MLKTKTVQRISTIDWDMIIIETYGKPYQYHHQFGVEEGEAADIIVPFGEWTWDFENAEIPFVVNCEKFGVCFKTWLNTKPEETTKYFRNDFYNELFWTRHFYPDLSMIVNDLHARGLLEAGEYIIVDYR